MLVHVVTLRPNIFSLCLALLFECRLLSRGAYRPSLWSLCVIVIVITLPGRFFVRDRKSNQQHNLHIFCGRSLNVIIHCCGEKVRQAQFYWFDTKIGVWSNFSSKVQNENWTNNILPICQRWKGVRVLCQGETFRVSHIPASPDSHRLPDRLRVGAEPRPQDDRLAVPQVQLRGLQDEDPR